MAAPTPGSLYAVLKSSNSRMFLWHPVLRNASPNVIMEPIELAQLIKTHQLDRTPFYYFKDKFALDVLKWHVGDGKSIAQLRQSPVKGLLQKPLLKQLLANVSGQTLTSELLESYWAPTFIPFRLSLGKWGTFKKHRKSYWNQTSRPGCSLVLHLNFANDHNQRYQQLMQPRHHDFCNLGHPQAAKGQFTMAWARMDVDPERGEVLIEELQNDWLRQARCDIEWAESVYGKDPEGMKESYIYDYFPTSLRNYKAYLDFLRPYEALWEEAMLSATLWFIREQLGISKVWYHSYETGNKLKQCCPPRSLYTKLPKRFGFQETSQGPEFILQDQYLKRFFKKEKEPKWFYQQLGE